MADSRAPKRWRPDRTKVVAGALVIAGLGLPSFTNLSSWLLMLAALGTFGPGVLREMGWLDDRDELERRADHRAGYHAFLTSGLVAFVLVAFFPSGERVIEAPQGLATLFLSLLWFTWFLSSLLAYWGPRRTAARILFVFGCVWLVFTIASNVGSEWSGWAALLLHPLLAAPFFVLAWLASRSPRVAGILLLAVAVFLFEFLHMFQRENLALVNQAVTFLFFLGPFLASGIVLLGAGKKDGGQEEDAPGTLPVSER